MAECCREKRFAYSCRVSRGPTVGAQGAAVVGRATLAEIYCAPAQLTAFRSLELT